MDLRKPYQKERKNDEMKKRALTILRAFALLAVLLSPAALAEA